MTFPADPLSLSWHLGCETSDLPLPWNPLSPPCTPEKRGSLGSMDSLDPPSQAYYYEGSLSPMDQGKRDSAYSSFSASSSTSDSALRPEESGSTDCAQPSQLLEPRYLQTGGELVGLPFLAPGAQLSSGIQSGSLPSPAKAAATPPQPPVRQDSLRACNSPPEDARSLSHTDSVGAECRWSLDTSLCTPGRDPQGPGGQLTHIGPLKESSFTDQYYLLSSHMEQHPMLKKGPQSPHSPLPESNRCPEGDHPKKKKKKKEHEAEPDNHQGSPSSWKAGRTGALGHRHSVPEHLLVAQLKALEVSCGQEDPDWTVSPLHKEQKDLRAPEPWLNLGRHGQNSCSQADELDPLPTSGERSPLPPRGTCMALERPQSTLTDLAGPLPPPAFGDASPSPPGLQAAPHVDTLPDVERSQPAAQKGGSAQHRSAQVRRRSDRFATNLRNEIQWRKAQLQKAKGPGVAGCEEQAAVETEEPPARTTAPAPPPPLGKSSSRMPAVPPKRWSSELTVFGEERALCNLQRPPGNLAPKEKAAWPEKSLLPAHRGGRGGRWRWSPEHKLQPQESDPGPSSQPPSEEPGLLPFADRRKFFEETSRPLSSKPSGAHQGRLNGTRIPETEKPGSTEHRDVRRHSLDQSYRCPASPPVYQDFRPEVLGPCNALAQHGVDNERWWSLPCSRPAREACAYSFRDECAMLHPRNTPVPSSHCAHHCHLCSWSCYSDHCCPAQQKLLEDGGPWQGRNPLHMESLPDEWETPAVTRANSHSVK